MEALKKSPRQFNFVKRPLSNFHKATNEFEMRLFPSQVVLSTEFTQHEEVLTISEHINYQQAEIERLQRGLQTPTEEMFVIENQFTKSVDSPQAITVIQRTSETQREQVECSNGSSL